MNYLICCLILFLNCVIVFFISFLSKIDGNPHGSEINTPSNIKYTCLIMSLLYGINYEEMAQITANNASKCFGFL